MNALMAGVLVFVLTLAAGYAGLHMQKRLVDAHKTGESRRRQSDNSHPERHQHVERGRAVAVLDQGRRAGICEADQRGV